MLDLQHGKLRLPAFLPDATQGVVRAVDSTDLEACGVQGLVMSTFHLMQHPGSTTVQALGGLHAMCGWRRPIITDSGGFQAYSLIQENPRNGTITPQGLTFRPAAGQRPFRLTPEKTIQLQVSYAADIVICLDYCTHAEDSRQRQEEAVRLTVAWAKRCKAVFTRLLEQRKEETRPLLFAVIQGGAERDLRKLCAEELLTIGFDGYGFGGWPLDARGSLLTDMLAYTRELVPPQYTLHALGVGHPQNVVECVKLGYGLFDSAMPTRDARHGRLYVLTSATPSLQAGCEWFAYVYVGDDKHIKSDEPVSPYCDCLCCARYTRGYLHHLFKIGDALFLRLATIHNIRFMTRLDELVRRAYVG